MQTTDVLILGIGNVLWADEGFGVRMVETLHQRYTFPPTVNILDGGTQGLYLLHYIQTTRKLLIFDAIDYGLPPGSIKVVANQDVPHFMGVKKMSLHQTGFQEVLAAARLTGHYPEALLLIGVQPQVLEDYGGSLTPIVKAQIEPALQIALEQLVQWGVQAVPRAQISNDGLGPTALDINRYENERPSETEACRVGDARILAQFVKSDN